MILLCPFASAQWVQTNGPYGGEVLAFAVSGTNLFAGTYDSGVFLSTNNGTSWTAASTGLTYTYVNALTVSPAIAGAGSTNLFAGTEGGGVFLSTNNGASWSDVGLTNTIVFTLAVSGTNLFAGVFGSAVWRRPLSEMTTSVGLPSAEVPTQFGLKQNYPNPFNPSTTFEYDLPKASHVSLTVYDILGREVSVLVNERRDAGVHEVEFEASKFASGVYLYRLQTGDFTQTKRLMLLK